MLWTKTFFFTQVEAETNKRKLIASLFSTPFLPLTLEGEIDVFSCLHRVSYTYMDELKER